MKLPFDHFDILAPIYEKVIRPGNRDEFWHMVDVPANGMLLDAGGGTGRVSQSLIGKTAQIVVSDMSIKMLQETRTKERLQPVCAPSENMPFSGNLFDRIIMVDALHHVNNQPETARELWRILKPGGLIIIEEPDIRYFIVKMIAIFEKLTLVRSHFLFPQEIAGLFSGIGGSIEIKTKSANIWIIITKDL
jgi:demethylmenaquinone methyltransferase/2-methoxy-6-polyprenyl-1,4-benzoquinol methylase